MPCYKYDSNAARHSLTIKVYLLSRKESNVSYLENTDKFAVILEVSSVFPRLVSKGHKLCFSLQPEPVLLLKPETSVLWVDLKSTKGFPALFN